MRLKFTYCIVLPVIFLLYGCNKNVINTEEEYLKYLNEEENQLVKSKTTNGFKLTVKYLPPEYLAYKELRETPFTEGQKDSLVNQYAQSLTFLMTIAPENDDIQVDDIVYYNIRNKEDYKKRVQRLNFEIADYISIRGDGIEYAPVLHAFENIYSMGKHRNIYLVFSDTEEANGLLELPEIDLVFNDLIFDTGISHFVFDRKKLDNIPDINFWNKTSQE